MTYEVEGNRARLVLYRDSEGGPTDPCPFCGSRHWHGAGDGHRAAHCTAAGEVAIGGVVLRSDDGYVVRTRARRNRGEQSVA